MKTNQASTDLKSCWGFWAPDWRWRCWPPEALDRGPSRGGNPRTDRQLVVRDLLSQEARRFDALTNAQQDAWSVAAGGFQSSPSLGQSGPLTGLQLFVRVNCKQGLLGQDRFAPQVSFPFDAHRR